MPDEHLVTLLSAAFSVFHTDDSAPAGRLTVVVIWTSFERPGWLRKLPEEINNYPTETTRRRPPIGYPPSGSTSPVFPVSVLVARRPPSERSASRDGEAPGSNGAEFHTIGEV